MFFFLFSLEINLRPGVIDFTDDNFVLGGMNGGACGVFLDRIRRCVINPLMATERLTLPSDQIRSTSPPAWISQLLTGVEAVPSLAGPRTLPAELPGQGPSSGFFPLLVSVQTHRTRTFVHLCSYESSSLLAQ